MIEIMESWFLADREQLAQYFGDFFRLDSLPGSSRSVESIPKRDVLRGMDAATKGCGKGKDEYTIGKARHAGELLARIDRDKVRRASPECNRLFQALSL